MIPNSLCFYTGAITVKLIYIEKVPFMNQINIELEISPTNLDLLNSADFSSMLSISGVSAL